MNINDSVSICISWLELEMEGALARACMLSFYYIKFRPNRIGSDFSVRPKKSEIVSVQFSSIIYLYSRYQIHEVFIINESWESMCKFKTFA